MNSIQIILWVAVILSITVTPVDSFALDITRSHTSSAYSGDNLELTLEYNISTPQIGLILKEYIPIGWIIKNTTTNYDDFNSSNGLVKWYFSNETGVPNGTIELEIEVPSEMSEGVYFFKGEWYAVGYDGNITNSTSPSSQITVKQKSSGSSSQTGSSTSSGGGGGGGGGGAALSEPPDNIESVEAGEISKVKAGNRTGYALWEKKTPIMSISFDVLKNPQEGISIRVQELKNTSRLINGTMPEGTIYKNVNINVGIKDYDITNAKIQFSVDNTWMEQEDVDARDISLYRASLFENKKTVWTQLKTTEIEKHRDYTYFEANSPGFSPFVIIAKKSGGFDGVIESISSLSSLVTDIPQDKSNEGDMEGNEASDGSSTDSRFWIGMGIMGMGLGVMVNGVLLSLYLRRRKYE